MAVTPTQPTLTGTRRPDQRPNRLRPDTHHTYHRGIDWIAVERAANGTLADPTTLTDRERREAWRLILGARHSRKEAAGRTGAKESHVKKWAEKNGFPALTNNTRRAAA